MNYNNLLKDNYELKESYSCSMKNQSPFKKLKQYKFEYIFFLVNQSFIKINQLLNYKKSLMIRMKAKKNLKNTNKIFMNMKNKLRYKIIN